MPRPAENAITAFMQLPAHDRARVRRRIALTFPTIEAAQKAFDEWLALPEDAPGALPFAAALAQAVANALSETA